MKVRYTHVLLIVEVILIITLASRGIISAKESNNSKQQQQQPLASVDKMIRQASGNLGQVNAAIDEKTVNNMTSVLNEMAANLRKMFMENKKMQQQMQEVLTRVSNGTGINATSVMTTMQQQAANAPMNLTSISSISNLLPRFPVAN